MNNFLKKAFYPPAEFFDALNLKVKTQISVIIPGAFVCIIMFLLFGVVTVSSSISLLLFGLFSSAIFFSGLMFIKKTKIYLGAYLISVGFLFATLMISFFIPYYESVVLPYRTACFIAVMVVCNQVISIRKTQTVFFSVGCMIIWAISCFTYFSPLFAIDFAGTLKNVLICTIGLILANAAIFMTSFFSDKTLKIAEKQEIESKESLETFTKVLEESKAGLNIGKRLAESADVARSNVSEIDSLYKFLVLEASTLSNESATVRNVSNQIATSATRMQGSIQEQNASITETSAALTEISANISNINIIANKRRAGMNEIVNALDAQMALIRDIVDKVEKVQQSSDGIAAFVNTVDSIASQTGLLAMNASIEAAHAGTLGKGFSVIAQEIRKLSEETTKNAALISETLKVNTEVVSSTTASVATFAEHTKKSADEIKTTVHAIEEILAGISEMDTGTQEIMKSLQNIVDEAHLNADLVSSVTKEITEQSDSINNISNFASEMESKVAGLDDYIRNIKIAIADIKKDAEQNNIVTEEINKIMQ